MAKDNFNRDNFTDYTASVEATKVTYQNSANISALDLNYDATVESFGQLLPKDTPFNIVRPKTRPDTKGKKLSQVTSGNRRTAVNSLLNNLKPMWNMGDLGNGEDAGFGITGKEILSAKEVQTLTSNATGQAALELKEKTLLNVLNRTRYNESARGEIAFQLSGASVWDKDNYYEKEGALDDLRGYYLGLWSQGKLYAPNGDMHTPENQKVKAIQAFKNFTRSLKSAGTVTGTIDFNDGPLMTYAEELMELGWNKGAVLLAVETVMQEGI